MQIPKLGSCPRHITLVLNLSNIILYMLVKNKCIKLVLYVSVIEQTYIILIPTIDRHV